MVKALGIGALTVKEQMDKAQGIKVPAMALAQAIKEEVRV